MNFYESNEFSSQEYECISTYPGLTYLCDLDMEHLHHVLSIGRSAGQSNWWLKFWKIFRTLKIGFVNTICMDHDLAAAILLLPNQAQRLFTSSEYIFMSDVNVF